MFTPEEVALLHQIQQLRVEGRHAEAERLAEEAASTAPVEPLIVDGDIPIVEKLWTGVVRSDKITTDMIRSDLIPTDMIRSDLITTSSIQIGDGL